MKVGMEGKRIKYVCYEDTAAEMRETNIDGREIFGWSLWNRRSTAATRSETAIYDVVSSRRPMPNAVPIPVPIFFLLPKGSSPSVSRHPAARCRLVQMHVCRQCAVEQGFLQYKRTFHCLEDQGCYCPQLRPIC